MVKLLHAVTLLTFLATTTANFAAYTVVPTEKCLQECQRGQACTEHQVECFTAPCDPECVCASRPKEYQTNPCNPEVCARGFSCVPASLNDGSPIAACAPECWVKDCGNGFHETCAMQGGDDGKEAICYPCYPVPAITCANVSCADSTCKMIDCHPKCIPLV